MTAPALYLRCGDLHLHEHPLETTCAGRWVIQKRGSEIREGAAVGERNCLFLEALQDRLFALWSMFSSLVCRFGNRGLEGLLPNFQDQILGFRGPNRSFSATRPKTLAKELSITVRQKRSFNQFGLRWEGPIKGSRSLL